MTIIVLHAVVAGKTPRTPAAGQFGRTDCYHCGVEAGPIVFDLFHTLVDPDDFRPLSFHRLEVAAAVLGVNFDVVRTAWERSLPQLLRGADSTRGLFRRLAKENDLPARTLDIAPAAEAMGRYQDLALLHPGADSLAMLATLHRRRLAVLTNCIDRDVEAWIRSPLAKVIEVVGFSTKLGKAKPELAAYEAVFDELGVSARECTFVGNGGDDELYGAREAGCGRVVHFAGLDDRRSRTSRSERERRGRHADVVARSYRELASIL